MMRAARARPGWWLGMVLVLGVVLVFSVVVGNRLTTLRQDVELGRARQGEWVAMDDFGLQVRVDNVRVEQSLPRSSDPTEMTPGPNGLAYVVVLMTVRAKGPLDDLPMCFVELRNAADEEVNNPGPYGLAGPESSECRYDDDDPSTTIPGGVEFQSQTVFLAAPAPASDFDVIIAPQLDRYWRVSAG